MNRRTAIPAFSGILAPVVMVGLWTIASFLRPGYNQLTQRGSELGTGPNSIVMNANFVITGLLIIVLFIGLIENLHGGFWSTTGAVFLGVGGCGEVLVAVFPCEAGCPLVGSTSQLVHSFIAAVFFGSIAGAPLLVAFGLDRDLFWKPYQRYSLLTGVLSIAGFTGFSWAVLASYQYAGLIQRLYLAAPFQWIGIMANRLRSFEGTAR